jgi:glycosyltransferase involved in cell wall biosynthesis
VAAAPRILFVTHNFPRFPGDAAGSFVLRLAVAVQAAGARVHVLASAAADLAPRDTIEGVPVERIRYGRADRQVLAYEGTMVETVRRTWGGKLALAGLLWHLRQAVHRTLADAQRAGEPFAVVHAHWWFPAGLSCWSAGVGQGSHPRLVVTLHGSDVRLAQGVSPAQPVMRRVLARAATVTAVSGWLARAATTMTGVPVQVAPMPVPTDRFAPPADDGQRRGVLFVGRLNAQKGVADLLRAIARTRAPVPLDVVGDGPDRASLVALADALGVAPRITWHGALRADALPAHYQRALVTVMPSREEGLGLVAVESQLSGTPVIAYDSGGLPDVVRVATGGQLVPVGDVDALASAIEAAVASPATAITSGVMARAAMLERFSEQQVGNRYLRYYLNQGTGHA